MNWTGLGMQAIGRDEGFGIDFTGDKLQEEPPSLELLNLHFFMKKGFSIFPQSLEEATTGRI